MSFLVKYISISLVFDTFNSVLLSVVQVITPISNQLESGVPCDELLADLPCCCVIQRFDPLLTLEKVVDHKQEDVGPTVVPRETPP